MVLPDAPDPDQGLTLTRPSPVTRCSRNRLKAAETTAPAAIADHETAEILDSSGMITASDSTLDMAASGSARPRRHAEPKSNNIRLKFPRGRDGDLSRGATRP